MLNTDGVLQHIRDQAICSTPEDQVLFLDELQAEIEGMLDALKREIEEDTMYDLDPLGQDEDLL